MSIEKLEEFAKDGDKNLDNLDVNQGFLQSEKPERQWFNDLFNKITTKTNEVIDDVVSQKTDTGITATAKFGGVERTQASVNAETVSLLDFGAPYSTDSTTQLQAALDYLDSVGGGVLNIPYHTGTLVVSSVVSLHPNITVNCAENLVIDCTALTTGYQFILLGSEGTPIALSANKTKGDTTISLVSAHGFSVGDDVLIWSQRECAHKDAGDMWRLGETTAGTASPFFAEPLVVKSVTSPTEFVCQAPLIFPDYRTDKTMETSPTARNSATVHKMNFLKNFNWYGGIFKKEKGSLFRLSVTKNCNVLPIFTRGYGSGYEIYNLFSLKNNIRAKVSRPIDWVDTDGQFAYNSIKDVSSWYTDVDLEEENGSQGLDQTFTTYCGIKPTYKVRHINSRGDAMTTHGNTYGATVDIYAVNCASAAFRNRARFCKARVVGDNNKYGLYASTWGIVDGEFDLQLTANRFEGVIVDSVGVLEITPAVKNSRISGTILMSGASTASGVSIGENLDTANKLADSKLDMTNLKIRSYGRAMFFDYNIHGVLLDKIDIEHYGTTAPVWFRLGAGHKISNFKANLKAGDGTGVAISAANISANDAATYGAETYAIDYKTCKVTNGALISNEARLIAIEATLNGTSSVVSQLNLTNKNTSDFYKIKVTSGATADNRIVLENSMQIGREYKILLIKSGTGESIGVYGLGGSTVSFLDGINDLTSRFISVTDRKLVNIRKVGDNDFIVYK